MIESQYRVGADVTGLGIPKPPCLQGRENSSCTVSFGASCPVRREIVYVEAYPQWVVEGGQQ